MKLYKFYSAEYGIKALEQRRLKLTQVKELNDPFELIAYSFDKSKDRYAVKSALIEAMTGKAMVCFSESWHNPLMWSHYADNHRGLGLCFEVDDAITEKVSYVSKRLRQKLDASNPSNPSHENMLERSLFTKFSHWRYEKERRGFFNISNSEAENGLYFESFEPNFNLVEILLGVNYQSRLPDLHRSLLSEGLSITTTRLSFQKFSIVRQQNRKLWKTL